MNKAEKARAITKAATYYIEVLKPAYDRNYTMMCEQNEANRQLNKNKNNYSVGDYAIKILAQITDFRKTLDEAVSDLDAKKALFEPLKAGFDGFDLKEMDNQIKASDAAPSTDLSDQKEES
jgi:hypothetical protein